MGKNLLLNSVEDVPHVLHMDDCSSDSLISATHFSDPCAGLTVGQQVCFPGCIIATRK